jgi:oxygen-dependent protoporphyrinogen oxidase
VAQQNPKSIAVIGGGLTGLTAAWRLHTRGHRVRLFEASSRVGGAVGSEPIGGWLVETGPNSLQVNSPDVAAVLDELGLGSQKLAASPAAKNRYVVRDGQLRAMPLSSPALLGSRLFSTSAKLRILAEIFTRRRTRTDDPSLATFVREHFGQEFVDYALDPLVSGIYAGDPAKLSARHAFPRLLEFERTHGSLLRAQIANARERRKRGEPPSQLISFAGGLQTLTDTLAAALPSGSIQLRAKVSRLQPGPPWWLAWQQDDMAYSEKADAIILAVPAATLTSLRVGNEHPLAALAGIEHSPVASLFLGFRHDDVAHPLDGFGMLLPEREQRLPLGVIFSSTLFPGRAPDNHVAITVMAGGARRPALARLDPETLLASVLPDLRSLLNVHGDPVFMRHTFWPRAIPQYTLGYDRFLEAMAATEKKFPGLSIGGHVRDGVALGACVASGLRLAECAATA